MMYSLAWDYYGLYSGMRVDLCEEEHVHASLTHTHTILKN